jgi:hypothetical protein
MSREAGCCAITGAMDMSAVDKLLKGDPNMDEELMEDTTYCEAAHIQRIDTPTLERLNYGLKSSHYPKGLDILY